MTKKRSGAPTLDRHSGFVIPSSLDIRHSSLPLDLIASEPELAEALKKIGDSDRVAIDTEADSLHSYREKLCLLQISVPAAINARGYNDFIVDPLAGID
ncbi:MAG: hypothetical protein DME84_11155, partial [Verrucomicrobia bacterium]